MKLEAGMIHSKRYLFALAPWFFLLAACDCGTDGVDWDAWADADGDGEGGELSDACGGPVCDGVCCAAGEVCTSAGCCEVSKECGDQCCGADETCAAGTCVACTTPLCEGVCCAAGEFCHGGVCCGADALCGADCCEADEVCEMEQCYRDCGERERCGEEEVCCELEEVCYFGECIVPSGPCDSPADCSEEEYCDLELGVCLPLAETGECQYVPGVITGEFNHPVLRWEWSEDDIMMAPAAGNLTDDNGDGVIDDNDIPDIVVTIFQYGWTSYGNLVVLSGDDGHTIMRLTSYQLLTGAGVAIGDVDGDGVPDITACRFGGGMYVFNNDGTLKWTVEQGCRGADPYGSLFTSPALADLEGDGVVEIVSDYTIISGGTFRCTAAGYGTANSFTVPVDIDGDGELEIVGGRMAMDKDCTILWQASGVCEGHPAIADLDADTLPESVVGSDRLFIMNAEDGSMRWPARDIVGGGGACVWAFAPAIADFDGDDRPEIVLAGHSSFTVYDLDCMTGGGPGLCGSGTTDMVLWTSPTDDASGFAGPAAFDFEGDGKSEVVYGDQHILRVYRGENGTVLYEDEKTSGTLWEYPLIVDVDNDNHAEIIVVSEDTYFTGMHQGVRVFADSENEWVSTRKIWNQHAYYITNINDDASVPTDQEENWLNPDLNDFRENRLLEGLFASPDLIITDVQAGTAECSAKLVLMARVVNQGSATAPAGIPVTFYEGTPEGAHSLVGVTETTGRLSPGASEVVSVDFPLTPDQVGVVFEFYAVTDSDDAGVGIIHECHEDNNVSIVFDGFCPSMG